MPAKSALQGFEFYQKMDRRASKEPVATITKSGTVSLNTAALKRLKVDPENIRFAFNSETYMLGMQFTTEPTSDTYKARFSSSGSLQVSAEPVLRHYGIDHAERRVYEPEVIGDDFIGIPLRHPIT